MNLLVTGAFDWSDEELNNLRLSGHNVVYMQQEKEQPPCDYAWVEGVIGNGIFLYHEITEFVSLRYIQLTSAGYDRVPMEYIKEKGIIISNARGVYSIPMAEFALGGEMQLYKHSGYFRDNQRNHKWEKHRGLLELYNKKVCIVGCGSVGDECAKRFSCFGCHIVGIDVFPYKNKLYESIKPIDEIDDVLRDSDIVVLTLPLTNETYHLMDAKCFSAMKPNSVLVNIARGAIVDTEALIEALNTHIGGAVLDVFEDEPLSQGSALWDMDNVIISPHNSFVSDGNHERMLEVIMKNLKGVAK